MAKKREFGEGPVFTVTNYILWIVGSNFLFGLCNILVLLFIFSPTALNDFPLLLAFCAIPAGPSFTALSSVMGKLIREKDLNLFRDFFKAYGRSFKQSMAIWLIELIVLVVLVIDMIFFARLKTGYSQFFLPIIYALTVFVVAIGSYAYPIISRFYLSTKDVLRLSFYYTIMKWRVSILNIAALVGGVLLLFEFTQVGIFIYASAAAYIMMFYQRDILNDIESKVQEVFPKATEKDDEERIFEDTVQEDK